MQVRGPPCVVVIAPRVRRGLNGDEAVGAVRAGQDAADAGEVGIEWRVVVVDVVTVTPGRVGLPHLDQRIGDRFAVFVQHAAGDDDALADRRTFVLRGQVMIVGTDVGGTDSGPVAPEKSYAAAGPAASTERA